MKLTAELLGISYNWQHVEISKGETRTAEFLSRNPSGRIPVIEFSDGRYLWESNAILNYFAHGSELLPNDRFARAQILQWQNFEQHSHEPYIAVARFIKKFLGLPEARRDEYERKFKGGLRALDILERHLTDRDYVVGVGLSIADISLYGYTHVAHEAGYDMTPYPGIRRWLALVAVTPGYVGME